MPWTTVFSVMVLAVVAATPTSAVEDASPYTVLIAGADHSLGYELTRQYVERGWTVTATAREPKDATELKKLAAERDNLQIEKLDVTSDRSVRALAARFRGQPVDVLITNSDIVRNASAQKYGSYDFAVYDAVADLNLKGPLRMVEAFMDNVAAGRQKKFMHISSSAGSIEGAVGGQVFYRSNQAALHTAMRTLSKEVREDPDPRRQALIFGTIYSGIGEFTSPASAITARESAEYCISVIEGYTLDTSGVFLDYKGVELP